MIRFKSLIVPVLVLPVVLFLILGYPVIQREVERCRALVTVHDLCHSLSEEAARAEAATYGLPPRYAAILSDYESLPSSPRIVELAPLSASRSPLGPAQRWLASFALWRQDIPSDILETDPVQTLTATLAQMREKETQAAEDRDALVERQLVGSLRYQPPVVSLRAGPRQDLPPDLAEKGLRVCGERIPLEQPEVRSRIAYQIEHLLTDLRDSTGIWLKRTQRYAKIVHAVLAEEGLPREFALLPAMESGYDGAAVSPAGARGWWQFTKATASDSLPLQPGEGWTLNISKYRDDRCDLVLSTMSAARYLKWMREHLGQGNAKASWLLAAAGYNAGFSKTKERLAAYGGSTFWEIKLPTETEVYVPRWIALCVIEAHRSHYGLAIPDVPPLEIDTIPALRPQVDVPLSLLATVTDSSEQAIRTLNPALDRNERCFRSAGNGRDTTHTIHVPKGYGALVLKFLETNGYLRPNLEVAGVSDGLFKAPGHRRGR
ncbi:MAG: lytic transglycosylase domain-containing protein [Thermodesulfobacteriota bacterium]